MEIPSIAFPDDDYAQSTNTLFHFMPKIEYLEDALQRHALVPRYYFRTNSVKRNSIYQFHLSHAINQCKER